ncbi:MAG: hypothetical protein BWY26_00633 [Elusimicrobia bacterium ADurb.Bin231]|nr:MAG: hypothetical protein BWY26_00633 [Elusimicrobia bacterium ADurb.Bin231]
MKKQQENSVKDNLFVSGWLLVAIGLIYMSLNMPHFLKAHHKKMSNTEILKSSQADQDNLESQIILINRRIIKKKTDMSSAERQEGGDLLVGSELSKLEAELKSLKKQYNAAVYEYEKSEKVVDQAAVEIKKYGFHAGFSSAITFVGIIFLIAAKITD